MAVNRALKDKLRVVLPAPVLIAWQVHSALRGSPEPEVKLLPVLSRGGSFLDVGANAGFWCGPAARAFAEVHAFEPLPPLAAALRRQVPANVTVHTLALSDHEGTGTFAVPIHAGQTVTTRASLEKDANVGFEDEAIHQVRLGQLDDLALKGVDAMKIDVEGHEAAVLAGARQTIERERPTLIVEIEDRHHPGETEFIIEQLVSNGYGCFYLLGGRLERFGPGSIAELQPADAVPNLSDALSGAEQCLEQTYVNNFVFVPTERDYEVEAMERLLALRHD